ncbi:hypothetical protein SDRG_09700 [Saprolegnia diclina VS20]|uniref:Uncharacterized protein n=1 Tax=Saprolegnia diclina (strain VS20) TaxID=1156394 RepID=T0Q4G8_SAPDV|nr:hypothetical protein SDRG_09700 [Saprolegnia diclina VS20]EQC32729.1 hypothetical protein SDRG_09700 [Saprolegnia diclina VS20]|eukprot:XP_008613873.1 hypothetical protein SDRG_09700 [Saprolegnia diclina VS20]
MVDSCMDRGLAHHQGATQTTYQWCDEVESYLSSYLLCHNAANATVLRRLIRERLEAAPRMMAATVSSIESGLSDVNTAVGLLTELRVAINNSFVVTSKHTQTQRDNILRKLDAANTCFEATRDALLRAHDVFNLDAQLVSAITTQARIVRLFITLDNVSVRLAVLEDNCTNLVRCCTSYKDSHHEYIEQLLQ